MKTLACPLTPAPLLDPLTPLPPPLPSPLLPLCVAYGDGTHR
jgi:hypothetical protein